MLLAAITGTYISAAALSNGPSPSEWREFRARLAGLNRGGSNRNAVALRQLRGVQLAGDGGMKFFKIR